MYHCFSSHLFCILMNDDDSVSYAMGTRSKDVGCWNSIALASSGH